MGPLAGIKVLEFESIGPAPFAGMLLADMGADVLVIDRAATSDLGLKRERWYDTMMRGKRSATLDMKATTAKEVVYSLAEKADALIEGMRPGVMERLGVGPDEMLKINPKLVYGRMTGWGQTGPLAARAGHDINYIALTGILNAIGRKGEAPLPPLNLIGDFGGGGMLLGFGVACGLIEAARSGKGQVIDAAMVEGASLLATMFSGFLSSNAWNENRGSNILDTGAPWYNVYETKDGKHVSIGAIEERFYQELLARLQLAEKDFPQHERAKWPLHKAAFATAFKAKTRDEWVKVFEGSDACFAPVLSWSEAPRHPHNRARSAYVSVKRVEQPAPAPRFSRTPGEVQRPPPERGEGGAQALADWGFDAEQVKRLTSLGLGFAEKK
ncbi:MAG: alpha-methylacyl-CoA racemase [Betaproteobacteria bacterium]|jgi:alpha-methylacyl-CoA racemase|nr:alpha-methylacyl-CoA racemase [Betaproteobacteria bacterium]